MCPSSLMADIRKYFSLGVGIVFALIAFKWWPIEYWLGDFADFTPFVLVAIFLTGLGVSAGVLQVPIGLFRLLASDRKTEEAKKEVICLGIREMVV